MSPALPYRLLFQKQQEARVSCLALKKTNKYHSGQTKPVCGLEVVQGPPMCNCCLCVCGCVCVHACAHAMSWTANSLDFYIELHLHRVKFKSQFAWLHPSDLSLGGGVTRTGQQSVSPVSAETFVSSHPLPAQPTVPTHRRPCPPQLWLFISTGCMA